MATEALRGLMRIVPNYMRLAAMLAIGLVSVPILIAWLGEAGFGLLSVISASVGIAAIVQQVIRKALLRELGAAYHGTSDDDGVDRSDTQWFACVFSSAFVVMAGGAVLTAVLFAGLWLLVPVLDIPENLRPAARWLVAFEGLAACVNVIFAAPLAMYLVKERFGADACWQTLQRLSFLLAAVVLFYGLGVTDPVRGLQLFAVAYPGSLIVLYITQAVVIMIGDRRMRPRHALVRRSAIREILSTSGWQSAVTVALNLHGPAIQIIVNAAFGVIANAMYAVALRLTSYIRMATVGVTHGLEAVSTRVTSTEAGTQSIREFLRHTTRLHAFVAVPSALGAFVLAEPLITLWIGRQLDDPAATIPMTVTIVQILVLALLSRAISDGWIAVMYGSGNIRRYAPLVVVGGIANPTLAIGLLLLLPTQWRFEAPAISFTIVFTLAHGILLPAIAARCFEMRYRDIVLPLLRPSLVALGCGVVLVAAHYRITDWTIWHLLAVIATYGVVYAIVAWFLTLTREERERFGGAAMRRLQALRA